MSFPNTPPQGGPQQQPQYVYVQQPPTGTRPVDTAAGVVGWLFGLFVVAPLILGSLACVVIFVFAVLVD